VSVWLQFVHAAVVGEQAVRFFFDVAHLGVDVAGKTARLQCVHVRDERAHGPAPLVDVGGMLEDMRLTAARVLE